jgi:hypothetical protein
MLVLLQVLGRVILVDQVRFVGLLVVAVVVHMVGDLVPRVEEVVVNHQQRMLGLVLDMVHLLEVQTKYMQRLIKVVVAVELEEQQVLQLQQAVMVDLVSF